MKNMKKSMKIILVSVISFVCVLSIAIGAFLVLKKTPETPLTWAEKVDLLGQELRNSNMTKNEVQVLDDGLDFEDYYNKEEENLIMANKNFFVTKNTLTNDKSVYLYKKNLDDNSIKVIDVKNKVSDGGFANENVNTSSIVEYNSRYIVMHDLISYDEESYSILKVIDAQTEHIIVEYRLDKIDDKTPTLSSFKFSDNGKSAVVLTSADVDSKSGKYNAYFIGFGDRKVLNLTTYTQYYGEYDENQEKTIKKQIYGNEDVVYSRVLDNGYVISINTKCYAFIVDNGKVYSNSFEYDESKVFKDAWQLPSKQIVVELSDQISEDEVTNISVQDEDYSGDPVYFNYLYEIFSLNRSNCVVSEFKKKENVAKIEFENASDDFYFTREYSVNIDNVLNNESKISYFYKDNSLVFEFDSEKINDRILNAKSGKVLTQSGIFNFSDNSTFEVIKEFGTNSGNLSNNLVNGEIYVLAYGSDNKYTLGFYSLDFDEEFDGIELVYGEEKTEFTLKNIYTDGENYIFVSDGKYLRFDKETKTFNLISNFYFEDKTFEYLQMNGVSLYLTKESDGTFNLYDLSGKVLFENITDYKFIQSFENGIILSVVSDSNTKNIAINTNFGMGSVNDYIERMSKIDNSVKPYSSTNQVSPYDGSLKITYYYGYNYSNKVSYTYYSDVWTVFGGGLDTTIKSFMGSSPGYGWSFKGWSNSYNGTGINYSENQSIHWATWGRNDTLDLYAVFERTITIKSKSDADHYSYWSWTQYGNIWTHSVTSTPTSSYNPNGYGIWSYYGFGEQLSYVNTDWVGNSNIQPDWYSSLKVSKVLSTTLTLKHYSNNSTGSTTATGTTSDVDRSYYSSYDSDDYVVYSKIQAAYNGFTRVGYTFSKWSYSSSNKSSYSYVNAGAYFYPPIDKSSTSKNVYMYAQWTANSYTVKFTNTYGNITGTTSFSCKFDQSYTKSNIGVKRSGYKFSNWSLSSGTSYGDGTISDSGTQSNDTTQWFYPTTTWKNLSSENGSELTYNAIWSAITYKIVLDGNSGNLKNYSVSCSSDVILTIFGTTINLTKYYELYSDNSIKATYGKTGTIIVSVQRTGYTFNGWTGYSKGTCTSTYSTIDNTLTYIQVTTNVSNLTTTANATITLKANWSAIAYKVTIASNGGILSSFTNPTTINYGTDKFTNKIYKMGYDFAGWDVSGTGKVFSSLSQGDYLSYTLNNESTSPITVSTTKLLCTTRNSTITLTAKWTPIKYNVKIEANDGVILDKNAISGCTYSDSTYLFTLTYNVEAQFSNKIYKTGYLFNGWEVVGTSAQISVITKTSSNGNVVVYLLVNQTTTPITATTTAKNLTTNKTTITLKAKWTPLTYYIQYNKNTPSKATSDVVFNGSTTSLVPTTSGLYGTQSAISNYLYSLKGWTQLGWSTNPSATEPSYFKGNSYSITLTTVHQDTIVFYAVWTQNEYNVKLDANGGTISGLAAQTTGTIYNLDTSSNKFMLKYDDSAIFTNNIVRHGYKFNGWSLSTNSTGGSVNAKQPSTYLSFADYYDKVRNTEVNLPLTTTVLNLTETANYTVTLIAQWTPITYYVQLNANASDASIDYPSNTAYSNLTFSNKYTIKYDVTGTFKVNIKRVGYVFGSWKNTHGDYGTISASHSPYTDTTLTILLITNIKNLTKTSEYTVILDLIWTNIKYKVKLTYGASSGTTFQSYLAKNSYIQRVTGQSTYDFIVTYDYDAIFTVEVKRPGYKFKGWKVSNTLGTNSVIPADASVAGDIVAYYDLRRDTANFIDLQTQIYNLSTTNGEIVTLTAEWTAITYTIHYNKNRPGADYVPSSASLPTSSYPVEGDVPNSSAIFDVNTSLQVVYYSLIGWTNEGWWFNGTSDKTPARSQTNFASGATGMFNLTYVDKSMVELYAIWRQNVYNINYQLDNKNETQASNKKFPTSAKFDDPAFEVSLPTKVGYTFVKFEISPLTTNHVKYYASVADNVESVSQSDLKVIEAVKTTYININVTDCFYKNLNSKDGSTVTFKAYWTKNRYKIEYDYNTGTADPSGRYPTVATYDESFNVTHPIKFGYTFTGWDITNMTTACAHYFDGVATSATSSASKVMASTFMNLHSETGSVVKFKATWRPNVYNVVYDYSGGGNNPSQPHPNKMTFDSWSTVSNAVRIGYTFTGWIITNMSTECDHYYGSTQTNYLTTATDTLNIENTSYIYYKNLHYVDGATINFKASWIPNRYKINYIVSYNLDGFDLEAVLGSTGSYPTTATFDTPFKVDAPAEAPFGYHFVGWKLENLSSDCKHYYGTDENDVMNNYTTSTSYSCDKQFNTFLNLHSKTDAVVTLRAMWAKNRYYITYEIDDHRVSDAHFPAGTTLATSALYNETFIVPKPVRTGYTFMGWKLDNLSDECKHYYYNADGTAVAFTSYEHGYYDVEHNNPTVYIVVDSTKFMNLHSEDGFESVRFIAKWQANDYTITYHYMDSLFDVSIYKTNPSYMNLVGSRSPYSKTKIQNVTYDTLFRTMKVTNTDDDPNGVTVPDNISIVAWMFFTKEITNSSKYPSLGSESGGYRLATLQGDTWQMATKYTLAPGIEYAYSSKTLFDEFEMFGQSVHAYAVYGKTNIELKVMGTDIKGDYNNMAKYYDVKIDIPVSVGQEITLPESINGVRVLGYMLSSTYYDYGELNKGSITKFTYNGKEYIATAGGKIIWTHTNIDAQNPDKPVFYLYVIYDDSEETYLSPTIDIVNNAIKFKTSDKFVNGQTYTISIRGLSANNYYDYEFLKIASSATATGSGVLVDKIYSHTGVQSDSTCPSNVSVEVNGSTSTILITFTATSSTAGFDLFLFYDSSKPLSERFIQDIEINIMNQS